METAKRVHNLYEVVSISHSVNTQRKKVMDRNILPPSMSK